jgi:hypothetical protein
MSETKFPNLIAEALKKAVEPLVQSISELKQERAAAPPVMAKTAIETQIEALSKQIADLKTEIETLQKSRNIEEVNADGVFEGAFGAEFGPRGQWEDGASFMPHIGQHPDHKIEGDVFSGIFGGAMRKHDHSSVPIERGVYSGFSPRPVKKPTHTRPRIKRTIGELPN